MKFTRRRQTCALSQFFVVMSFSMLLFGCEGTYPQYTATYEKIVESEKYSSPQFQGAQRFPQTLAVRDRMDILNHYLAFNFSDGPLRGRFVEPLSALLPRVSNGVPLPEQGLSVQTPSSKSIGINCYANYRTEMNIEFWPRPALLDRLYQANIDAHVGSPQGQRLSILPTDLLTWEPDSNVASEWLNAIHVGKPTTIAPGPGMRIKFNILKNVANIEGDGCPAGVSPGQRVGSYSVEYISTNHEQTLSENPLTRDGLAEGRSLQFETTTSYPSPSSVNTSLNEIVSQVIGQ